MQLILYEEFSRLDFDWKTFREDFLTRIAAEFNAKYPEKAPQAKKKKKGLIFSLFLLPPKKFFTPTLPPP